MKKEKNEEKKWLFVGCKSDAFSSFFILHIFIYPSLLYNSFFFLSLSSSPSIIYLLLSLSLSFSFPFRLLLLVLVLMAGWPDETQSGEEPSYYFRSVSIAYLSI